MKHLLFLCLAGLPTPALADLTATYGVPGTVFLMKVEIAANGDVHGDFMGESGRAFITRAGHGYFVLGAASHPVVISAEDAAAVIGEQLPKRDPALRSAGNSPRELVANGSVAINGRTGPAYFAKMGNGKLSCRPVVVISHDPALAPLGKAMSGQFDMSTTMMGGVIDVGWTKPMRDILETGAPLLFAGAQLQAVTNDPIPAAHFELPAQPASLDEVRKEMTPPAAGPK